jgi:formate hydrogenlyase subunit 6/NADH:ubiquinone oxidoreductase subunit I
MRKYFHNLTNGVKTVFEGMSISLASMFVAPVTIQYPDVDISSVENLRKSYQGPLVGMPDNYRGVLDVTMEICTACKLCEKACPISCIIIDAVKCDKDRVIGTSGKEAVKTRTSARFDIDVGKCMFCGLCVIPCPTGAIHHTNVFELNKDNLNSLILRFVSEEKKEQVTFRAQQLEEEAALKKAAKIAAREAKEATKNSTTDKNSEGGTD